MRQGLGGKLVAPVGVLLGVVSCLLGVSSVAFMGAGNSVSWRHLVVVAIAALFVVSGLIARRAGARQAGWPLSALGLLAVVLTVDQVRGQNAPALDIIYGLFALFGLGVGISMLAALPQSDAQSR
jgi:hypothetical protein